jgi:ribonuclease R
VLIEPRAGEPGRADLVRAIGGPRGDFVGVLLADGWAVPWRDDPRAPGAVRLPRAAWRGAVPDDVVRADLVATPRVRGRGRARGGKEKGRHRGARATPAPLQGRVVEVLGPLGTPDADFHAIAWRHRLPIEFPPAAVAEAAAHDATLPADGLARCLDLRAQPFVTIDPVTARDHDDAVFVEPAPKRGAGRGGDRLWVAIADVARFVPEGSALDDEARRRGNSVYFPDRAIPMLPERLSGELCSLRPDTDRLVLAVAMDVSQDGVIRHAEFHEAVIRSRARLVYDDAAIVMDGGDTPAIQDATVREQLVRLATVGKRLTARRFAAGAIDFDLPSAEIVLGDEGHPTDIVDSPRTIAHRSIEEAMLAANRAVAEHLLAHGVPALFRVHEPPLPEALEALRELLESLGLLDRRAAHEELDAAAIQRAVQRAAGRPEERLVNSVALRSLRQARYDAVNRGHFALAFDAYLHFTSPIRRYADLVVHRQLRDLLTGSASARSQWQQRGERLAGWGASLSWCERAAMEAERDAVGLKKCVFLQSRVGERFAATVTRVSRYGLHVTLDPFFVEGLVPIRTVPGYWDFDEAHFAWVARGRRDRLQLGDRVEVALTRVEMLRGWIDFALVRRLERPA